MNEVIGRCPKCSNEVVRSEETYACETVDCDFEITKIQSEKKLTEKQVIQLLNKGKTGLIKGFIDENGDTMNAVVFINSDDYTIGFDWKFGNKKKIVIPAIVGLVLIVGFTVLFFFSEQFENSDISYEATSDYTTTSYVTTLEATTTTPTTAETAALPPRTTPATPSPRTTTPTTFPPVTTTTEPPETTSEQTSPATTTAVTTRTPPTTPPTTATTPPTTPTTPPTTPTTSRTTPAPQLPSAPTNLRTSVNASGNVVLIWNAVANADGYEISRSRSMVGGFAVVNLVATQEGNQVRAIDGGVSSGRTYFYSVRAFWTVDGIRIWSEHSAIVSVEVGG